MPIVMVLDTINIEYTGSVTIFAYLDKGWCPVDLFPKACPPCLCGPVLFKVWSLVQKYQFSITWEVVGNANLRTLPQTYWLRISGNSVTSKPSLLKFENCWRKSHLKGTWVDSSGQAAWLYIAVVKFSMLLSRHPKENSMDKTVDWKHTKSNQVVVPAWKKNRKEHAFWISDSKEKSHYKHEPTDFSANDMPVLQTLS